MKSRKTTEQFIDSADKVHSGKYDYSKVEYIGSKSKIEIVCKKHGSFFQVASNHLQGKGCISCGKITQSKDRKKTTEQFVEDAIKVHGDKYDYSLSEYITTIIKVKIICKLHKECFEQTPNKHLMGRGCPMCKADKFISVNATFKTQEQFVEECKIVHNSRYSYENSEYKGVNNKIKITCSIHSDFLQKAANHLQGQGCPKCAQLEKGGGFSRSGYIERASGRVCTFYTLRCFNEEEEFYKIGITMNTTEVRYQGNTAMPYEYEVISEIKGSAGFIWDLELAEKRKLKKFKYVPLIDFNGSKTECFTDYKV